jgi:hypothetical protein
MARRRTVLVLVIAGIAPAFAFVNGTVTRARARRQQLASEWAARGDRDLAASRPGRAADDYRTAQQYAADPGAYRLQLSKALLAAGRFAEAQAQLLTLLSEAPADGVVNLELGRAAAMEGDEANALRYYHAAIDGEWERDPLVERRNARIELATFLLGRGDLKRVKAELDASDPSDPRIARLAGEVAYLEGDFRTAHARLQTASQAGADDSALMEMLDTSARVLALDPYASGLSSRERVRRIVRAFAIASAALDRCTAGDLDDLRDRIAAEDVSERVLLRDAEAADEAWMLVAEVSRRVSAACGDGQGDERALALVVRSTRSAS